MAKWIRLTDQGWRVEDVQPQNGTDFKLQELRDFVDGFIEVVELSPTEFLIANEESAIRDFEYNPIASSLANEPIFGNVLICLKSQVQ